MGVTHNQTTIHWNYFLALEEDLVRLSRFVEFSDNNNETYSIEIARIYLSTCAEIDVVCKQLCEKVEPGSNPENIVQYKEILTKRHPNLAAFKITIPRFGTKLNPWINWNDDKSPYWWTEHNQVKHQRHEHFDKANLKNCINSLGALFILLLHLYEEEASEAALIPIPKLFNVDDKNYGGVKIGHYGMGIKFMV